MDKPEADFLKPTVAPKPADLSPEFARLEQLTRDLNKAKHPAIAVPEGAKVNQGEYSAPSGADGATTTLTDPIFGAVTQQGAVVTESVAPVAVAVAAGPVPLPPPPPSVPSLDLRRVFFTGRSGAGKSWLAQQMGAAEFKIQDPILRLLSEQFESLGQNAPADIINLIIAWGEGAVSTATPLTVTRMLFMPFAKQYFGESFGTRGFWVRKLIDESLSCDQQTVITTVTDQSVFTALKEAGFTHVHVMCSNPTLQTRSQRKGANNTLADHLDNQVLKAISVERAGEKLKVVWNDDKAAPISARLYDVGSFLAIAKQSGSGSAVLGE